MRRFVPLAILAAAGAAIFPQAAEAQRQCKEGSRANLTGTIQKIERGEPEPGERIWIITPQGTPAGACAVKQLWGRGQPPGSCTQGTTFSASGKVVDAESLVLLNVDSVTCK
ncbi:MAG: hypothetical protein WD871_02000 [Xanthobacteraceae bacterium]